MGLWPLRIGSRVNVPRAISPLISLIIASSIAVNVVPENLAVNVVHFPAIGFVNREFSPRIRANSQT